MTADVAICENGVLPQAPDVYCGAYLRAGSSDIVMGLADAMAKALRPEHARLGMASADESWSLKD